MDDIFEKLTKKKKQLDRYRPLPPEQLQNIREWLDVEYTYTSNAIEGSTLNRSETALVLEKGITVRGKTLAEHLAAAKGKSIIPFFIEKAELAEKNLLQIGKIASFANIAVSTVRYYLAQGLIKADSKSKGGFMLFGPKVVERIKGIKRLQQKGRLSINEIRNKLGSG